MLGIVPKYAGNGEFQFWNQQLKKYRNMLTKYIINTWITSIHKKLCPIQEYQYLWKLDWWHKKLYCPSDSWQNTKIIHVKIIKLRSLKRD